MIKIIFCVRRRPDISQEAFHKYWREQHGPLVRKHAETLRICRYIQCHTIDTELNAMFRQGRGTIEPYDGTAELWWDSLEDMAAGMGSEDGQAAGDLLLDDEKRFIDLSHSSIFLTEEYPVIDP